jgi:formylglycine-generating enzyme required for sulfatase activity
MVERSGLLYAHEGGYSFGDHLTVQEFLAANYLVDNVRGTPDWTSFLCARAGQSWWREVMMLVAGSLVQWPQQARRFLLDELGGLPEAQAEARAYGLAWAGRALLEIPERRVGWHANARSKLARRLVGVLWQRPPQTTVGARIEAGAVLGRLGDPRFGGPCALPEFIPLPGGAFWMGSGEQEVARLVEETGKDWFERELPRHRVAVSPFSLSKYPTTNAMYALFVEAGGYAEARWWAEAIADGCWKEGKIQDWLGAERDRPYYWEDEGLNGANQPVVGVTWYEAAAYCRWLTAALDDGARYRLPTEAEWAYAARGAEGRAYPWGDGWQAERANTEELGLKRTTPVGAFPDGGTPEGVLDMAGNAWAWCQDWFDEETYRRRAAGGQIALDPAGPKEGRYRVLRGGSARDDRTRVRCAFRVRFDPGDWVNNIGFRVARGAP